MKLSNVFLLVYFVCLSTEIFIRGSYMLLATKFVPSLIYPKFLKVDAIA